MFHDEGAFNFGVGIGEGLKLGLDVVAFGLAEEDVAREWFFLGWFVVAVGVVVFIGVFLLLGVFVGLGRVGGVVGHEGGHLLFKKVNAVGNKFEGVRHSSVGC